MIQSFHEENYFYFNLLDMPTCTSIKKSKRQTKRTMTNCHNVTFSTWQNTEAFSNSLY